MYDLAVIGLGPAGLEAVDIAIKNNLSVIAFEKNELGGTCLNIGCVPTKSILHDAFIFKKYLSDFSWKNILDRKNKIVSKFTNALNINYSKKITLIKETASLNINKNDIEILTKDNKYQAKNIIIATGSTPFELKGLEFDHKFILNSDDLFNLETLPKSIAIIGSGAIGLEWAQIFSYLNVEVKIIEKAPNIAPLLDIDLQKRIERFLKLNKIEFYKDDFVVDIKDKNLILNSGKIIKCDIVLSAVGRKPLLPNIFKDNKPYNLEINSNYGCEFENLFIAGDSNSDSMLAHSASYQARSIMNKILFNKKIIKKQSPSVIYITPEVASIGIREQDIDDISKYQIKKLLVPSLAKSWCDDSSDGIIKVILKDDLIEGAHIVSKEASSLISIFNILIEKKIPKNEILDMIFPHPSYSEAVLEVLKSE